MSIFKYFKVFTSLLLSRRANLRHILDLELLEIESEAVWPNMDAIYHEKVNEDN